MNPARSDNMIIQSICLLDQLDKDLNTFTMRMREWYCWHFPELRELVKDNYMFARCAAYIKVEAIVTYHVVCESRSELPPMTRLSKSLPLESVSVLHTI